MGVYLIKTKNWKHLLKWQPSQKKDQSRARQYRTFRKDKNPTMLNKNYWWRCDQFKLCTYLLIFLKDFTIIQIHIPVHYMSEVTMNFIKQLWSIVLKKRQMFTLMLLLLDRVQLKSMGKRYPYSGFCILTTPASIQLRLKLTTLGHVPALRLFHQMGMKWGNLLLILSLLLFPPVSSYDSIRQIQRSNKNQKRKDKEN